MRIPVLRLYFGTGGTVWSFEFRADQHIGEQAIVMQ